MPQTAFQYKVRARNGQIIQGEITGANQPSVIQRLQAQGYAVLSVEKPKQKTWWDRLNEPRGRVPAATLAMFCRQFAVMLASGMSIIDAMRIVNELVKDDRLKQGLAAVRQEVISGNGLGLAMAAHPKTFPPMVVQMVEAGEISGALNEVMERLAIYYEREAETRAKIKEALTYPALVAAVSVVAVNILVFFVLPNFVQVFSSMNMQLPWMTQLVLDTSAFVLHWWWAIIAVVAAVVLAVSRWLLSPGGRLAMDVFLLRAPLIGPAASKFIFGRMSRSLGLLMRSGIPMVEALHIVEKLVLNIPVAHALARVRNAVERGASLTTAITKESVFPRMLVQMVQVGEESGAMDVTLDHLANFYDQEAGYAVKSLTTLIEPVVIVLMTGFVLFLALAVVVPMFQMSTTVPGA